MGLETYLFNAQPHHELRIGAPDADDALVVHGGETVQLDPEKDASIIGSSEQLVRVEADADHPHREVLHGAKQKKTKTPPTHDASDTEPNQTDEDNPNVPLGQEED